MKTFTRIAITCVAGGLAVMLAIMYLANIQKAQNREAEFAFLMEDSFLDLSLFRPDETHYHAAQVLQLLEGCVDPNIDFTYLTPPRRIQVETARVQAVSNLVSWLEGYSGMTHGTNIRAWQDWLDVQAPTGNAQE